LSLPGNKLVGVSATLPNSIKILDLSNNELASLGNSLDALILYTLNVSSNFLQSLPRVPSDAAFCKSQWQCYLDISNNFLTELDNDFFNSLWPYARIVDVSQNHFTTLPPVSGNVLSFLPATYYFNASHNQLTVVPNLYVYNIILGYFDLSFNKISGEIPYLGYFTNLVELNLNNNQFTSIDPTFQCSSFIALKYCNFVENPLSCPVSSNVSCCATSC
jgi:Leucine-rich repeat (LRR) protein